MPTRFLADNWTFQNAGEFLCQGLDGDTASELVIPDKEDAFHCQEVPADVLRFECLSQVWTNLVLSDELWVDCKYVESWEEFPPLEQAKAAGGGGPKPFTEMQGHWIKAGEFLTSKRLKIYLHVGKAGFVGSIQLPPIMVEVIEASNSLYDVVNMAVQLRDHYKNVREWLGQLQRALNNEDIKEVLAREKRLQSISRHLDSLSAVTLPGDTTLQFGISWLKVGFKGGSPLNAVQNLFGIRVEVNSLVLASQGQNALKKLLRILGEQHTKRGRQFKEKLIKRF